jgi:murein DD-endopeptidase MepM/ murein hydrolase activator NlpD
VTGPLRVVGLVAAAALVLGVAAMRVPDQERLPLSAVVAGARVSQPFGCSTLDLEPFDPFCPSRHVHTGIDLAASVGTPVHSATSGVTRVGVDPVAGIFVVIVVDAHVRTLYCHLSQLGVATGQSVVAGDVIGAVGATGLTTGAHLHFEVQVDGRYVDPAAWLAS